MATTTKKTTTQKQAESLAIKPEPTEQEQMAALADPKDLTGTERQVANMQTNEAARLKRVQAALKTLREEAEANQDDAEETEAFV